MTLKFAYGSDLHLEFGKLDFTNSVSADVLLLAGDICVVENFLRLDPQKTDKKSKKLAKIANSYYEFFDQVSANFEKIYYVLGNHEFYNGDIATTIFELRKQLEQYPNIQVLENELVKLAEHIYLIGATLWTDVDKKSQQAVTALTNSMNDYHIIVNSNGDRHPYQYGVPKLTPLDTADIHAKTLEFFDSEISAITKKDPNAQIIVMTHHTPSQKSIVTRFLDSPINAGYCSSLDEWIAGRPNICKWIHGHTHNRCEYNIGNTQVLCNPRGYSGYEIIADYFELAYFEIEKEV